jgi:environmental stress-induced protein Ves
MPGVNVTRIAANEYRRERWSNGLGWTREVARAPAAGDFDWRVSIAEVDRDAPFSAFPGVEREIVLLSGDGMRLHVGDDPPVDLLPPHGRLRFSGEQPARAELVGGPTTDYNLMWRPARIEATLLHRPLVGPMLFFAEPGVQWLVTLLGGRANVKDALLPIPMEQGDTVLIGERDEGRVVLEGGGELLLARLARLPHADRRRAEGWEGVRDVVRSPGAG